MAEPHLPDDAGDETVFAAEKGFRRYRFRLTTLEASLQFRVMGRLVSWCCIWIFFLAPLVSAVKP